MQPRHRLGLLVVALALVASCDVVRDAPARSDRPKASERRSTLSQPERAANLTPASGDLERAPTEPDALFAHVVAMARSRARAAYRPPDDTLPAALADLPYEHYRLIYSRPERALWHDEAPFVVQLIHPGFIYRQPVAVNVVAPDGARRVPFDPGLYRYVSDAAPVAAAVTPDLGYAGFRVFHPLEGPDGKQEIVVFLGASYFRMVGPGQVHGLSSRGLAVDIATDRAEEFPAFREYWLVRPSPDARTFTFVALLDGPSVTGAYRFDLAAEGATILDVDARVFARRDTRKLGVAPLSSMFLYGQNRMPAVDDFRPEVHDSDGLLMHTAAGEWIWRPLANGPGLRVTSLRDESPRGFGLIQRERAFDRYLDLEARYHRRPSEWVEVIDGDWGRGGVELLAIPTDSEFNDNVAAYWAPDDPFEAGDERRFRYRLRTFDDRLPGQTLASVVRTRIGHDALPGQADAPPRSQRRIVVDFGDTTMAARAATDDDGVDAVVEAVVETTAGTIDDVVVQALPDGGWRATFGLRPDEDRPADMRLYLHRGGERLSETWTYVWYPQRDR